MPSDQEFDALRYRVRTSERTLDVAREAVRAGDWDALWRALDVSPGEAFPYLRTGELVTAPDTQLTAEQEIRARAIHDAAGLFLANASDPTEIAEIAGCTLAVAREFAAHIAGGTDRQVVGYRTSDGLMYHPSDVEIVVREEADVVTDAEALYRANFRARNGLRGTESPAGAPGSPSYPARAADPAAARTAGGATGSAEPPNRPDRSES